MAKVNYDCRHIMPDGRRCQSPALRGTSYCYFHSRLNRIKRDGRNQDAPLTLPDLEDPSAIQLALNQVAAAIAAGKLDPRQASLLLRTFRLASDNLSTCVYLASRHAIEAVCDPGDGEEIAAE